MSAVDQVFTELREENRKAFIPFITAGDPDLEFTAAVIKELAACGSNICEVGIPYSDPIADGPVIQASYTRALQKHIKLQDILGAMQQVSGEVRTPLVTMASYAIIHRHGLQKYVEDAQAAGIAGAIVPDLLVEESEQFAAICEKADFSLIQLVTPTTPRERAIRIANTSTGFLYYVSITGITGERTSLPAELTDNVAWLREQTALPICIGFGISQPEHVTQLSSVADGVIVGSAFVRRIADLETKTRAAVVSELGDHAKRLISALNSA